MARGIARSTLVTRLKAEIRASQETNTTNDAELGYKLEHIQEELCTNYDWPFLRNQWDKALVAATQYYTLPTSNIRSIAATINFERPVQTWVKYSSNWLPVCYGVGPEEYNTHDPADSEYSDPVLRWTMSTNTGDSSNPDEFEIWPVPNTAQTFRFVGQRNPRTFSSDSDKCELDDLLIVLFAAAEILAHKEQASAAIVLRRANERLAKLRAGYPTNDTAFKIGSNTMQFTREQKRLIPLVVVS